MVFLLSGTGGASPYGCKHRSRLDSHTLTPGESSHYTNHARADHGAAERGFASLTAAMPFSFARPLWLSSKWITIPPFGMAHGGPLSPCLLASLEHCQVTCSAQGPAPACPLDDDQTMARSRTSFGAFSVMEPPSSTAIDRWLGHARLELGRFQEQKQLVWQCSSRTRRREGHGLSSSRCRSMNAPISVPEHSGPLESRSLMAGGALARASLNASDDMGTISGKPLRDPLTVERACERACRRLS